MRSTLFGFVAGLLLSLARAPLGLDLLQWPAVEAELASAWRALALGAIAIGFAARSSAFVGLRLLAAIVLGFAVHALLLAHAVAIGSTSALLATLAAGTALLVWLGRGEKTAETAASAPRAAAAPEVPPPLALVLAERAGLAAAAAGAAIALEGVARHARLFGAGLAQDDALMATVFLAAVAFGAAAFGWLASRPAASGLSLAVALAATAAACYTSMRVVTGIASMRDLDRYVKNYGLDTSRHGTLAFDALIAAACFIAPALLVGCALRGATRRAQHASVLAGAALGLLLVPRLLARGSDGSELSAFSAALVPHGTRIAVVGAALAVSCASGPRVLARSVALAMALVCAVPTLAVEVLAQPVLSPWLLRPVRADRTIDLPAGLLTVEPSPGEVRIVTLDRRALSPTIATRRADARRLALAFELLPARVRVRGALQVLLVGQLTPERARVLSDSGATRIDRSGGWHAGMEQVEKDLFQGSGLPAGERLTPGDAHVRVAQGAYDLVIVPPVPGDAPRTTRVAAPEKTVVVAWLELTEPAWHRDLGEQVLLSADGFESPCIAVLLHAQLPEPGDPSAPFVVSAGSPRSVPTPIYWLTRLKTPKFDQRTDAGRAGMFARLAEAAQGGQRDLLAAIEAFYRAQTASSPFETDSERVELPLPVLDRLRRATLEQPANAFIRELWEGIARLLIGKRAVGDVYDYVEPVAQKHGPWPRLEVALALADLESLDWAQALRRLEPLSDGPLIHGSYGSDGGMDVEVWYLLGEAHALGGDPARAAQSYRRALELAPGNWSLRRKRAIAAVRASEPGGRGLVEELVREAPDDEELAKFAGPGPYPAAPRGFQPLPLGSARPAH